MTKASSGLSSNSQSSSSSASATTTKLILGWREWISFPDFDGVRVKAKIDTGARTSALHALNIEPFQENGEPMVAFDMYSRLSGPVVHCTAPLIARRRIRNSGGQDSFRHIIGANINVGDRVWPIEISLTQRERLQLRMLLGRTALGDRYLVDPAQSYLHGN